MKTQPNPPTATPDLSPFAGHTPGPWLIRRWEQSGQFTVEKKDAELRSKIAILCPTHLCDEHGGTTEANARLIAACPTMLAEVVSLQAMNTALLAENARLRAALESLLPLAIHTSPEDVAVHQARAALGQGVQS